MKQILLQHLHDAQMHDWCGKVLYSGVNTLKKGNIYMLGYNPGGDPVKEPMTLAQHVEQSPLDWNEYIDAMWMPRGRLCQAGQALLQRRVRWLLEQLGQQPREVCASNLIFRRSKDRKQLGSSYEQQKMADQCWPIHKWIMEQVQPHIVLCIDSDAFKYICRREQLNDIEQFAAGHGNWQCNATKLKDGTQLISVPNLSLYAIDYHPEVVSWIGTLL
jgi:hypothetical protein